MQYKRNVNTNAAAGGMAAAFALKGFERECDVYVVSIGEEPLGNLKAGTIELIQS
jgi:hypothetical protein